MNYDFDTAVNRFGTLSSKWDVPDDVIPMTTADMDFRVAEPILKAMEKRLQHGIYGYNMRPDSYYEAVIDWTKRRYSWNVKKEWICHSPGVVGAVAYAVQAFTKPGEKVLVQPPVYHPFNNMVRLNDRVTLTNPLVLRDGDYFMDFDDLRQKAADPWVRMMILCSPHNPAGRIWTEEELTAVAEICLENNVLLLSDELHADILFHGKRFTSLGRISAEKGGRYDSILMVSMAASKSFNLAGLQNANFIIASEKLRAIYMRQLDAEHSLSSNTFGSIATEAAYREGEEWLEQMLNYVEGNIDYTIAYFKENMPDTPVIHSGATYMVWVDCRAWNMSDEELTDFFHEKSRVHIVNGAIFGEGGSGFIRINLACPRSTVDEALRRIKAMYDKR